MFCNNIEFDPDFQVLLDDGKHYSTQFFDGDGCTPPVAITSNDGISIPK